MKVPENLSNLHIFLIGFTFGALYFYVFPYRSTEIKDQIKSVQGEIASVEEQMSSKQKEANREPQLQSFLDDRKKVLQELESFYPPSQTFITLSDLIRRELVNYSIREIVHVADSNKLIIEDNYEILPVGLILEGSYTNILSFLGAISNHNNLIVSDGVLISKLPESDNIRLEVTVKGYRVVREETEEGTTEA